MWLEVNAEGDIVGAHSARSESENQWIEYNDGPVNPGDRYVGDILVPAKVKRKKVSRAEYVTIHTRAHYPLQEQVHILRKGDPDELEKMNNFFDRIDAWCKDTKVSPTQLKKIIP